MFGRKTKKAKAITAQQTAQPKAYQVWYRNSVGMWVHGSTHTNITDARSGQRCYTIAQTEIREIYA